MPSGIKIVASGIFFPSMPCFLFAVVKYFLQLAAVKSLQHSLHFITLKRHDLTPEPYLQGLILISGFCLSGVLSYVLCVDSLVFSPNSHE